jgi:putative Holliday junction resolvase
MRMLGIDPGEKRIGIAISDITGTLARPLEVVEHTNRREDSEVIAAIAKRDDVEGIVVGQATDIDGKPNFSGRKAARLAAALREASGLPVHLWDESYSTEDALAVKIEQGASQKKRRGHHDATAAAIILQSYLDHINSIQSNE